MNPLRSRDEVIRELSSLHRNLLFDHFHYNGRDRKSVFRCKECGLYFRQSIESLLQRRRGGKVGSTACACRLDMVKEWDLPETYEERKQRESRRVALHSQVS